MVVQPNNYQNTLIFRQCERLNSHVECDSLAKSDATAHNVVTCKELPNPIFMQVLHNLGINRSVYFEVTLLHSSQSIRNWLVHSLRLRIYLRDNGLESGIKVRKYQREMLPVSGALREFKTALWLKSGLAPKNLSPGVKGERGSGVWGAWEASSRVQVLVFSSLKRRAAGIRSRNQ